MPLYISSLNSGSNANCYYIGNDNEAVLIDAGLSCRETEKRMKRLGLPMEKVKAIFVSHEHSDHITGIPGLSRKFQLPVYFTTATFRNLRLPVQEDLIRYFQPGTPIGVGSLDINAFPKYHDAIDPHSFIVSGERIRIGIFTDIGTACSRVADHFSNCHAAFLEANYCERMLEKGNYPYHLKKRISSNNGHLSNDQALALFIQHRSPYLSHLVLSHLSKNNNCPELVGNIFKPHAGKVTVHVASRYAESPVFRIEESNEHDLPLYRTSPRLQQLSLFD